MTWDLAEVIAERKQPTTEVAVHLNEFASHAKAQIEKALTTERDADKVAELEKALEEAEIDLTDCERRILGNRARADTLNQPVPDTLTTKQRRHLVVQRSRVRCGTRPTSARIEEPLEARGVVHPGGGLNLADVTVGNRVIRVRVILGELGAILGERTRDEVDETVIVQLGNGRVGRVSECVLIRKRPRHMRAIKTNEGH